MYVGRLGSKNNLREVIFYNQGIKDKSFKIDSVFLFILDGVIRLILTNWSPTFVELI